MRGADKTNQYNNKVFFGFFFFFSSLQCFNGTIGETKFLKRSKNRKEKKIYIYILIFSRKNKVEWFG